MSVPVLVEIPLVSFAPSSETRRGRVLLWSEDLRFDFEELDDGAAPVVVISDDSEIDYRFHEHAGWLRHVGPRPDANRQYRWMYPTFNERPGEFGAATMHPYVPKDRRKALINALDRVILGGSNKTPTFVAGSLEQQLVERQMEDRRSYGDSFKVVGDSLYRLSAEPFFLMRDDGFIVGSHSSRGWKAYSNAPWELYSCAEISSLLRMSQALDKESSLRTSLDRFHVLDHPSFTPTFVEQRMGLLVYRFWLKLMALMDRNNRLSSRRLEAALADELDGGVQELKQVGLNALKGVIDDHTFALAEVIMKEASSGVISQVVRSDGRTMAAAIEVLR